MANQVGKIRVRLRFPELAARGKVPKDFQAFDILVRDYLEHMTQARLIIDYLLSEISQSHIFVNDIGEVVDRKLLQIIQRVPADHH